MTSQRDVFITELFEMAKKDKDIVLLSVDMGAPSLDCWRTDLPQQFFAMGISEQHSINFAAGLASQGKKVYVYYMAAWSARCFEQIRYSCAMAKNPITILGNGVALGYTPAGPAHCPNEDIAYMRSLCDIEIYSPSNNDMIPPLVQLTYQEPGLRYIRLERKSAPISHLYNKNIWNLDMVKQGIATLKSFEGKSCILSSGYMLGRAVDAAHELQKEGILVDVVDMWKIKNLDLKTFSDHIEKYDKIITLEEQSLSGGVGSVVCELLADSALLKPVLRLGLPDGYIFDNGTRDQLIDNSGLSVDNIVNRIKESHAN
jgi:transketolase